MRIISFDNSKKGIAKNAFWGFVFQFIIKFKGVIILPLIVNFLSKETLGEYRLISTSLSVLVPLVTLNVLDGSGMFFSADMEPRRVRVKYFSLLHFTILLTLLSISFSIILKPYIPLFNKYTITLILYLALTVIYKLAVLLFQTYQKSTILLKINFIIEYGAAILTILLIVLGIRNIFTLLIPVIVLNSILSTILLLKVFNEIRYGFYFNLRFIKQVLPVSIPLIPVFITEWILSSIGIYLLQYYYTIEVVGNYSVLLSIASLLLTLRGTLQFFWFSTCSNMLQCNKHEEFQEIFKAVIKSYTVISVFCLVIYGFFSRDLVQILANKTFLSITRPLFITALGYIFLVFSTIWNGILYANGKTKKILINYTLTALITLICSIPLVMKYEIMGASIAYMLGNLVLLISMAVSAKSIKISLSKNEKVVCLSYLIVIFFSFCFQYSNIEPWPSRIAGTILGLSLVLLINRYKYLDINKLSLIFKK